MTMRDAAFEPWLEQQLRCSAEAMLQSFSPLGIVKPRPGFGQVVTPIAGAIVASPVLGAYDPDPDYFFHWFRDSAVVIDALRLLHADGLVGNEALLHLRDFTAFSLALNRLDGRIDAAVPDRRARVAPDYLQFLREDGDLSGAHGDAVAAEARVNPDGTLDVSRWARPQHDGPPLRALAMLRWSAVDHLPTPLAADVAALIRFDLDFTLRHAREPSYDIWEEELGHHYYTLRVSTAALEAGAVWCRRGGDPARAECLVAEAAALRHQLDAYWVADPESARGHYRSRLQADGGESPKALDIAVILAAIHVDDGQGDEGGGEGHDDSDDAPPAHTVADPRMQATLARLEAVFDAAYPINHGRAADRGPAMGRYAGDVYYSGGAYYFSTLGAAEFCFRAAGFCSRAAGFCSRAAARGSDARHWFERGDAYLATVRAHTPAGGALSEQFDQTDGTQTSAKQLAWSHAAFISCVATRRRAAAIGRAAR